MKGGIERLVALLAASGYEERDLISMARAAHDVHPSRLVDMVSDSRKIMSRPLGQTGSEAGDASGAGEERVRRDAVDRVANLLIQEAKLSPSEAALRMAKALPKHGKEIAVFRPKDGLRAWLTRISSRFSPSELLHYATRIRNESTHQTSSDWPLRDRD